MNQDCLKEASINLQANPNKLQECFNLSQLPSSDEGLCFLVLNVPSLLLCPVVTISTTLVWLWHSVLEVPVFKKSAKRIMQVPRLAQLGCLSSPVPNTP
jgi:hypothetical protein